MAFSFSDKVVNPSDKTTLIVDALKLAFRWKHEGRTDFRPQIELGDNVVADTAEAALGFLGRTVGRVVGDRLARIM